MMTNLTGKNKNMVTELKKAVSDLYKDYKTYGEVMGDGEGYIYIIYTDGSHKHITLNEYSGEKIKLTDIAYIRYMNGYTEQDTLNGDLFFLGMMDETNNERYNTNIEIMFGTKWGNAHNNEWYPYPIC